jgi:nucleoside-diphosphate-sugar epimerase
MKILVAGGAGYVGSLLVPALVDHGYEVDVIDLLWFGNHLPKCINVIQKDLHNCTIEDIKGHDQVVFLAGLSNDPMAEFDPSRNFIYNASLPAYIAFLARSAGVKRFIYASSCSVYGYTKEGFYDETSPTVCNYPYGISKLQGEKGVMQLQTEDFSVIALRKGTICGYSPRMRFDLVANTMYRNAVLRNEITIHNPSLWRPILDIRDAVFAYLRAIQADYSISGIFNVASQNTTIGALGDTVKFVMDPELGRNIKLNVMDWQDLRNYKVQWNKAKDLLGYEPKFTISDLIRDLHPYHNLFGDMDQEIYSNIAICKKILAVPLKLI